ncbi:CAAX protease self-immunity [Thermanaeromonas toyohensis ToBE]|uniref:CAAX protease self-immunity n=1 Tax=Thermanaeromonas toyohensis ToBE TaxID=698762 RepID=A0A1W1W1W5_9FIRM|nr:CPBP family glutamic-type intramembrane protease [Thermanaeromonas toyohensis]SMB99598.1 CAAX protease self-immunity [Thermanaeromonas toyohensis ToBE]
MRADLRSQMKTFGGLLVTNALLVLITYLRIPPKEIAPQATWPAIPQWQLALVSAGLILAVYGLLGMVGFWFARRLGLPGIYRPDAGLRLWIVAPLVTGLVAGNVLVVLDRLFALSLGWDGLPHPSFPLSLLASATAGIGEEIVFRLFVLGLLAFLLNFLLNLFLQRRETTGVALWLGNIFAALAFAAAHLPAVAFLLKLPSPAAIPHLVLAEVFLLNGIAGLLAGWQYIRCGLVAAVGVHFWSDIIWHVLWPAIR